MNLINLIKNRRAENSCDCRSYIIVNGKRMNSPKEDGAAHYKLACEYCTYLNCQKHGFNRNHPPFTLKDYAAHLISSVTIIAVLTHACCTDDAALVEKPCDDPFKCGPQISAVNHEEYIRNLPFHPPKGL